MINVKDYQKDSDLIMIDALSNGFLPMPEYVCALYNVEKIFNKIEAASLRFKGSYYKMSDNIKKIRQKQIEIENIIELDSLFKRYFGNRRNFMVLCQDIKQIEDIEKIVRHNVALAFPGKQIKSYILRPKSNTEAVINDYLSHENADCISLIFSTSIFAANICPPRIEGAIFFPPTSSYNDYLRQFSPVLSVHSKVQPLIIDLIDKESHLRVKYFERDLNRCKQSNIDAVQKVFNHEFILHDEVSPIFKMLHSLKDELHMTWDECYNLLEDYTNDFGELPDITTIFNGYPLGDWLAKQIKEGSKGGISEDRRILFNKLGVTWEDRKNRPMDDRKKKNWENQFNLLQQFVSEKGYLPQNSDTFNGFNIGFFLNYMRKRYRQNKLEEFQIKKLEDLGVVWHPFEDKFNHMCNLYIEFIREFGRRPKQSETYKGEKLGIWFRYHKKRVHSGEMNDDRKKIIEAILNY